MRDRRLLVRAGSGRAGAVDKGVRAAPELARRRCVGHERTVSIRSKNRSVSKSVTTRAFGSRPVRPSVSIRLQPRVSSPLVSTSTTASSAARISDGSRWLRRPSSRVRRAAEVVDLVVELARLAVDVRRRNAASGVSRSAIRASLPSSKTPCERVSVQVKSVSGKPALRTIFAASGSTIEVVLRRRGDVPDPASHHVQAPRPFSRSTGSRATAAARFVNGACARIVNSPGLSLMRRTSSSTACSGSGRCVALRKEGVAHAVLAVDVLGPDPLRDQRPAQPA